MQTVPVFVVNLRHETEKMAAIENQAARYNFLKLMRIGGVYGSSLPDQLCFKLTNDPNAVNAKGAVGCFLSHIRAWELLVAYQFPWAIVIEDDAVFRDWSGIPLLGFPEDFDLILANNRTEISDPKATPSAPVFKDIKDALFEIERRKQAVGTDCYILSIAGANKLLEATGRDWYFGHIDLRMLAYSLSAEDVATNLPNDGDLRRTMLKIIDLCKRPKLLKTYTLVPSLVDHIPAKDTSRTREDALGLTANIASLAIWFRG